MKLVVGLTGGIGSGKSAAADEFARLGATVVDTDAIAHGLTGAGGSAMPEVERIFGQGVIDSSGAMDRRKMRERVFAEPAAKKALEALLHPMIREESRRRIDAAQSPYVVHVVPLLVESADYRKRVDRVLVVDCPEALQVERVRARSALPEAEVRAIMASQAARADRLAAADDVIDNSGTLDALRKQVAALHRRYLEYSAQAPG
jgi:dephospho-CoA kinase